MSRNAVQWAKDPQALYKEIRCLEEITMIKILADSTCDLSQEVIERYNIGVAPLTLILKG